MVPDFLSKKVLTRKGFRDLFVLVFLHEEQPHQGLDDDLLTRTKQGRRMKSPCDNPLPLKEMRCLSRLGGLLKHYFREAT